MALDSGLRVPLIVSIPAKFQHLAPSGWQAGGSSDRLVAFVDFAPTVLSLAGVDVPEWYQGAAFLGTEDAPAKQYLFGFRDRMDERIDLVRTVYDGRYLYSRNYLPHRSHGQHVDYLFQTPTTRVWHELYQAGEVSEVQSHFWSQTRSPVELYDLENDPDELVNLVESEDHRAVRLRLARLLEEHLERTRDVGFLPEGRAAQTKREAIAVADGPRRERLPLRGHLSSSRAGDWSRTNPARELAAFARPSRPGGALLGSHRLPAREHSGQLTGCAAAGQAASTTPNPSVVVAAAEWNVRFGKKKVRRRALQRLVESADVSTPSRHRSSGRLSTFWTSWTKEQGRCIHNCRRSPRPRPALPRWAASYVTASDRQTAERPRLRPTNRSANRYFFPRA